MTPRTPATIEARPEELAELYRELFGDVEVAQTAPQRPAEPLTIDDNELLQVMFRSAKGNEIRALWNGSTTGYVNKNGEPDHSGADLALVTHLVCYTQGDMQRVDRLFRQSGLYRPKWDERRGEGTYGQMTLDIAAKTVPYFYDPSYRSNGKSNGNREIHTGRIDEDPPEFGPHPDWDDAIGEMVEPPTLAGDNEDIEPDDKIQIDVFKYQPEDGGILDAWRELYAHLWRYDTGRDQWLRWTASHWEADKQRRLGQQIQELLDLMNQQARQRQKEALQRITELQKAGTWEPEEMQWLKDLAKKAGNYITATKRTRQRRASIEDLAKDHQAIAGDALDAGNVLNLRNGTYDLDTYELRPHSQDDLLSYCLDYEYDPGADCPRWKQFVKEVLVKEDTTEPDDQLIALFQELVGYSLTTDTRHETMIWMSGDGSNGKTVTITVKKALLGPMAIGVDFHQVGTAGNYDLAELPGKRVVWSTESERGNTAPEGYIKRIVSGEVIHARPIYGAPFDFRSAAKIWWAMNDRPVIKDTSNAIWRRLKLIPFNRTFGESEKDVTLTDTLLTELPGIFNWAIEGLKRLRTNGRFTKSEAVMAAVKQYQKESNPTAQWLDERTITLNEPVTPASELYADYEIWCNRNGRNKMNATNFGNELKRLGAQKKKKPEGIRYYLGLLREG